MNNIQHLAAAIEKKYGLCADTAVERDGSYEITRWDESIAGRAQPSEEELQIAINEYVTSETSRKAQAKALWQSITDPDDSVSKLAIKQLLKPLLIEMMEQE